jgi:mRNA interferase RelE/StbE
VRIENKALKQFRKMERKAALRLRNALLAYETDKTGDVKKLQGRDGYRLRIGDYRAIFEIVNGEVVVLDVGTRGDIYK